MEAIAMKTGARNRFAGTVRNVRNVRAGAKAFGRLKASSVIIGVAA